MEQISKNERCPYEQEIKKNGWEMNYCMHCLGIGSYDGCLCIKQKKSTVNRISKDNYYLDIAMAVLKRSTCLKRHYGCVIVKNDAIISTGYNGSSRGTDNCCDIGICKRQNAERYSDYTLCMSIHAEQNAIIAANANDMRGATVYLACETPIINAIGQEGMNCEEDVNPIPCPICARMLRNAGIERVVNRIGEIKI